MSDLELLVIVKEISLKSWIKLHCKPGDHLEVVYHKDFIALRNLSNNKEYKINESRQN